VDPIAGVRYSRATSIVSSAYKRHGRILEVALRESLRDSNRHWQDATFRVPREADALANTQDLDACRQSTLPYGSSVRTLQVDMVALDNADSFIRAYEIKRGNGQFDAGKIRSITRDLKCIQVLKQCLLATRGKPLRRASVMAQVASVATACQSKEWRSRMSQAAV
jgi:hypothetical protein